MWGQNCGDLVLMVKTQRKNFREEKTIIEPFRLWIKAIQVFYYMEEKTEVNDDYIICPFLHSARPGIAFRSSALSSNIFFLY